MLHPSGSACCMPGRRSWSRFRRCSMTARAHPGRAGDGPVTAWCRRLTARAIERLAAIPGLMIHGPRDPARRTSPVAFSVEGRDPVDLVREHNEAGVEARAGCHCATFPSGVRPGPTGQLSSHPLPLQHPRRCRSRRRGARGRRRRPPATGANRRRSSASACGRRQQPDGTLQAVDALHRTADVEHVASRPTHQEQPQVRR